jgi:CRP-like cAMP-binding protein
MAPAARKAPDLARTLRSVPLLQGVSEAAIDRLARVAHVRTYPAGALLFREGEPSDALFVVLAGRIVVTAHSAEGAEVMLNIIDPAQVVGEIGLIDGGPRTANVAALRDTRAILLSRAEFLRLLDTEPNAARSMLLLLCSRLRQTTSFLEDAVLGTLPMRLLRRLQALAQSYGRVEAGGLGLRIEHGLSQQELGDSIGVSRVSVNQQLNAWRSQGLLDFGRGFVVVHDLARLENSLRDA